MADENPTMYDLMSDAVIGNQFIDSYGRVFVVEEIDISKQEISTRYLDGNPCNLSSYEETICCRLRKPESKLEQIGQTTPCVPPSFKIF